MNNDELTLIDIKPVDVRRSDNGYWRHPDFPVWDENTNGHVINQWFDDRGLSYYVSHFQETAGEEQIKAYLSGEGSISDWFPKAPKGDSFLLSIHETDDGPVAVFGVRK